MWLGTNVVLNIRKGCIIKLYIVSQVYNRYEFNFIMLRAFSNI
jgi:hypothetical protein